MRPRFGEVYSAINDVVASGIVIYKRASSGSFDCIIPKSTKIVVENDPPSGAIGIWALPVNYSDLEKKIVPRDEFNLSSYNGYGISLTFCELNKNFTKENIDLEDIKFDNIKMQKKWELFVKIHHFQETHLLDEELPVEIRQQLRELD